MDGAARNGHLEVVQWLDEHREEGCSVDAMNGAAENGHLAVVQWLGTNRTEGCTVDAMNGAAWSGHLNVVQWLHENQLEGCTVEAMDGAAQNGHLDVVEWLHANRKEGCTTQAMDGAAKNSHLHVVQWLHTNRHEGCTTEAMDGAAWNGYLVVVQWLHANRVEGCTAEAMDSAAQNGHLRVVQWLHLNRTEGCSTVAMNGAVWNGHLSAVQWLHVNRTEGCNSKAMDGAAETCNRSMVEWLHANRREVCTPKAIESALEHHHLGLVRIIYVREEMKSWPRPAHIPALVKLARSNTKSDLEILKYIASCRRDRYQRDAIENPLEYASRRDYKADAMITTSSVYNEVFIPTSVEVLSAAYGLAHEISERISAFMTLHPSRQCDHETAARRGWVHWLLLFSEYPSQDMTTVAEIDDMLGARRIHEHFAKRPHFNCSKRFMYLTVEKGDLDFVNWHMLNCATHSVDEWLYVSIWIGRVDVVEWICATWSKLSARGSGIDITREPLPRKTLFNSLDASFAEVEARFVVDLMDIMSSMTDAEKVAQEGGYWKLQHIAETEPFGTNLADLAAIHGHLEAVEYLVQHRISQCTISGLFGAIDGAHMSVVRYLYQRQPRLLRWPRQEDGGLLFHRLLMRDTKKLRVLMADESRRHPDSFSFHWLLDFLRHDRKMRLDARSLEQTILQGDMRRVRLICRYGLVEDMTNAADIAAVRGDLPILEAIYGASLAKTKCTTCAMDGAAEEGHLAVVHYLHQRNAPCTRRAIDLSARNGHVDVVQYLLQYRNEGYSPYALYWASVMGHVEVVKCLITHDSVSEDLSACLRVAQDHGHGEVVTVLETVQSQGDREYTKRRNPRRTARMRPQIVPTNAVLRRSRVVVNEICQRLGFSVGTWKPRGPR